MGVLVTLIHKIQHFTAADGVENNTSVGVLLGKLGISIGIQQHFQHLCVPHGGGVEQSPTQGKLDAGNKQPPSGTSGQ